MARKTTKKSRSKSSRTAVRKKTVRKSKAKSLPFKKWLQTIKDSEKGGQASEDTKGTKQQRRGGL